MSRTIRGNAQPVTGTWCGPDRQALSLAASMAIASSTLSPMSVGVGGPFGGDPGYGVNRWSGRTSNPQAYVGAAVYPVGRPPTTRVGAGYGVVDGSAYPTTRDQAGQEALAWMSPTRRGMG